MRRLFERIAHDSVPYAFRVVLVIVAGLLLLGYCMKVRAAPVAVFNHENVTITITDEPCALKTVSNLPQRATWKDKERTWEGCAGSNPMGVIIMYWDDGSIVVLPRQVFVPVRGI